MATLTIPKTQQPDARIFQHYGGNFWLSNRTYKTQQGAQAWLDKVKREHPRKNNVLNVVNLNGIYYVRCLWIKGSK